MNGRKLLLLRPQLVDDKDPTKFRPGANTIVAVDSVGAGIGEMVMFCQGSSARLRRGLKMRPWTPSSSASSIRWMCWEKKIYPTPNESMIAARRHALVRDIDASE